jgi:major membrane immunogen (membrane-anchored lipoprotein)
MTLNYKIIILIILSIFIESCGNYSFTGASIPDGTESFQVNFFENEAGNSMGSIFEPGLDRDFTIALQNILQNQTNLQLLSSDADLIYEGEIKDYRVSPMTSTSNLQASQNRLTVGVNVRFINIKKEEDNFERKF